LPPEEFRKFAHQAVDWMADYLANPGRYPVLPHTKPGELIDARTASTRAGCRVAAFSTVLDPTAETRGRGGTRSEAVRASRSRALSLIRRQSLEWFGKNLQQPTSDKSLSQMGFESLIFP
jgi:hypothetical protein